MKKAEERGALAMRLHAVAIHLLRGVRDADAASGLTPARLSALSVLVFGGGRTIGELASAEQVTPPTMTRLVSGLEREGLVRRSPDARDGRLVRVTATARARRVLEAARSRRVALLGERLDGLSEDEWGALSRAVVALERVSLVAVAVVCLAITGCAGESVASAGKCSDGAPVAGAAFEGEEWARDHTLRSALEHSVVWYYREGSRRTAGSQPGKGSGSSVKRGQAGHRTRARRAPGGGDGHDRH